MSKMKAVVLEKSGSRYTVLGEDGTFRQVYRRLNAEVGEEVQIQTWTEYFSEVRIWAGAVALFLLVLTSLLGWGLVQAPTAVALLSVDINPSLQLELDNQGHLVKFQTQDAAAKHMLSRIDLTGKPIEEVLEQLVTLAYDQKFLSIEQPWVVVGYSPMTNKNLEQMPKALNEQQIISWVTEIGEKKGLTPQVAVFSLTSQERELAQKRDLTLGEYALWQTADKAGVVTQPENLKDTSERIRLLENPQVQVEIKAVEKERQSILIAKPGENGTEKRLPAGKLISPTKDLYPWIDKSRSEVEDKYAHEYMQKEQHRDNDTDNANTKAEVRDKYQQNDQDIDNTRDEDNARDQDKQRANEQKKYQKAKESNKANTSEHKETQNKNYDNTYVPSIPNPENSRHDLSRSHKFSEDDRDKYERR